MMPVQSTSHPQSPQQWFRASTKRSIPDLAKSQHPNRVLGFSSIRELAKSPRQALSTLPSNTSNESAQGHRDSLPRYGDVKYNCNPPEPDDTPASDQVLRRCRSSSSDSRTPDHSGLNDLSQFTTPPSTHQHDLWRVDTGSSLRIGNMGQKASTIHMEPSTLRARQSLPAINSGHKASLNLTPLPSSTESRSSPKPLSQGGQPPKISVPRRRSSLTVLHLDRSHFEKSYLSERNLSQRASTLTESARRTGTFAETVRPLTSAASNLPPTTNMPEREATSLSPALLSPSISDAGAPLAPSHANSANFRSSVMQSQPLHLPKTFPDLSASIPIPSLTITHFECYQGHRRIWFSRNKICPVPCMACGKEEGSGRWKCTWCALRICGGCMAEFESGKRDLRVLLTRLEENKKKEAQAKVLKGRGEVAVGMGKENIEIVTEEDRVRKEMAKRKTR